MCVGRSQALLGAGKTLQSKITRHEFLDFCRRSPEIRSWINFFDDPRNDMDKNDSGGSAGGSIGAVKGFTGMSDTDAKILIIREDGQVGSDTLSDGCDDMLPCLTVP